MLGEEFTEGRRIAKSGGGQPEVRHDGLSNDRLKRQLTAQVFAEPGGSRGSRRSGCATRTLKIAVDQQRTASRPSQACRQMARQRGFPLSHAVLVIMMVWSESACAARINMTRVASTDSIKKMLFDLTCFGGCAAGRVV